MKKAKKILLLGKEKSFLVSSDMKKMNSNYGELDVSKAKIGKKIKTNAGHVFAAIEPTIIDMLRKCRRGPQIIMPKDAAAISAMTGLANGWRCLDAGGGSGFLSLFLANNVKPDGHVFTYEKEKGFAKNIQYNIEFCGLEDVMTLKNKDVSAFNERDLDLITLDMRDAEKIIPKAYRALRTGGWLCVYSPHIEQQKAAVAAMQKAGFIHLRTMENIQREWKVDTRGFTHPKPSGILHTGFMTFGRKI
ncbi:MAG: methyltransferase domain-containing protein [Candidatus Aenigmarchaeota archaeon]|nr:methyltransferase domain-containing protein [Candidatus Aenigmarchaeota archaeon]